MCMINCLQQDLRGKMSWALEKGLESWGEKILLFYLTLLRMDLRIGLCKQEVCQGDCGL